MELTNKNIEHNLIEKAKYDVAAQEAVINKFSNLIYKIALSYMRSNFDLQDLYQQGVLGILRAIKDFDLSLNMQFSTYARWWIRAHIREFFLEQSKAFSMSASVMSSISRLQKIENKLIQEQEQPVSIQNLAEASGLTVKKIQDLYKYNSPTHSIYEQISEGETLGSIIADNHCDSPQERLIRIDSIEYLRQAIKRLTAIEQSIIVKRYDLDGNGVKTLEEVGQFLNLSGERVRQIQEKAEKKLKSAFKK
jgi:RNA polymerase primary sigma factor